jgi:aerobic carbon-monoxide dehydrogenase medium subunit
MYPEKFDYVRASSVEEALKIVKENSGAKLLAGGHSLLPAMKLRLTDVSMLVDISRIASLKGVSANGSLTIGALTTHAEVASNASVQKYCAALAQATGQVGDRQVRNFGTLGGNIAHADPASDPPTVLVACDATIHVQGSGGKRSIKATEFFIDLFATALGDDEIITAIEVPNHSAHKCAYVKLEHPASRYAVVGVAVCLAMNGNTCSSAAVALGGATNRAIRCPNAEAALAGKTLDDAALNAAAAALASDIDDDSLMDDVTYPATYRKAMVGVYLKRAVKAALG